MVRPERFAFSTAAIALAALAFVLAAPRAAFALTDAERAGARAAAQAGEAAFKAQRWSEAVDYYRRAESIVHSPVHLLFIGRAEANQGRLIEAREALLKVQREELAPNAPAAFRTAQEEAVAELAKIEPRLAHVTITVTGAQPGEAAVTSNGQPIPPALVGVPIPMNPGTHALQASVGDRKSEVVTLTVAEGARQTATLVVPEGAPAVAGSGSVALSGGASAPGPGDAPGKDSAGGGPNTLRIVSFAAMGVGVVGLGVGTVFGLQSNSKRDDADALYDECSKTQCTPSQQEEITGLDDDADGAKTIATVGFIAGGVALASGIALFFVSAKDGSEQADAPGVRPWVGLGSAGVAGTF